MNYYVILYLFSIIFSSICGVLIFRRYQNIAGFFFLLFTVCLSIWYSAYFLFFTGIENTGMLLFFSRLAFGISIPLIYSFLLFIKYFQQEKSDFFTWQTKSILAAYALILGIYIFMGGVVSGLEFSQTDQVYRETYGPLYFMHVGISIAFLPLFIFFSFRQLKVQTLLNRIRFRNIIFAAFVVIFFLLVFQLILPAFGIWLLEQEIIFLLAFFVMYIFFTLRRYYFSAGYELSRGVIILLSVNASIIALNVIRWASLEMNKNGNITSYW